MPRYGQFCPVAKGAEVLGERWTLLVVRQLIVGATRFSEIQRSLAKASPAILTKRLRELEDAGIVTRSGKPGDKNREYRLTKAGAELKPLIETLGVWATRWATNEIGPDDLDEYLLVTDIQRRIDVAQLPQTPVTLHFRFSGPAKVKKWWFVADSDGVDLCDQDPGYDVDLDIATSLKVMVEIWMGLRSLVEAKRAGKIRLTGDKALERSIVRWLGFSGFANVERPVR